MKKKYVFLYVNYANSPYAKEMQEWGTNLKQLKIIRNSRINALMPCGEISSVEVPRKN